jgi:hypothetical protein
MAKQTLASMSVDALLKLRDDIGTVLLKKSHELQSQFSRLGDSIVGKGRKRRASALKGPKSCDQVSRQVRKRMVRTGRAAQVDDSRDPGRSEARRFLGG